VDGRRAAPGPVRSVLVDALLYGASALLAAHVLSSPLVKHRTWAAFAWPVYASASLAAIVLALAVARPRRLYVIGARLLLAAVVFAGTVAAPLAAEVHRRADREAAYAPAEVVVTESAAAAIVHGRDPYSAHFGSPELAGREPSIAEHFPYLPLMTLFGVPHTLRPSSGWTDGRLYFALVTLLAALAALGRWKASAERRLLAVQALVLLPTGALPLVAGSDDMPVLGLSLLALVLFSRGRSAASALAITGAALLKLTAWPLMVCLALVAGRGRRIRSPLVLAPGLVLLSVLATAAAAPGPFVDDVLLFPLDLSSLPSPAASTTVGSTVMSATHAASIASGRVLVTIALLAVALLLASTIVVPLARSARAGAAEAAAAAGLVLGALILLAPVGRIAYFVYPVDLLLWSALLRDHLATSKGEAAVRFVTRLGVRPTLQHVRARKASSW